MVDVVGDLPQQRGPAGFCVDPPLAALADQQARVARVHRAAAGAVVRGAEVFLQELAGARVERGEALGQPGLRHPEPAQPVDRQAPDGGQPIGIPGAWGVSARLADLAQQLAFRTVDEHLVVVPLLVDNHRDVDVAVAVGSEGAGIVQPFDQQAALARLRVQRQHLGTFRQHIEEVVAHHHDPARDLHGDRLEEFERLRIHHGDEVRLHRREEIGEGLLEEAAVALGQLFGRHRVRAFNEALFREHGGERARGHVADVRGVIVGSLQRPVFRLVSLQPRRDDAALAVAEAAPDRLGQRILLFGELRHLREELAPIGDLGTAHRPARESQVELPAVGGKPVMRPQSEQVWQDHPFAPEIADLQIGHVAARPGQVLAVRGVHAAEDLVGIVVDVAGDGIAGDHHAVVEVLA